eukprot:scaffold5231_cov83-Cylindrotheca_fusiformis.AAC.3
MPSKSAILLFGGTKPPSMMFFPSIHQSYTHKHNHHHIQDNAYSLFKEGGEGDLKTPSSHSIRSILLFEDIVVADSVTTRTNTAKSEFPLE